MRKGFFAELYKVFSGNINWKRLLSPPFRISGVELPGYIYEIRGRVFGLNSIGLLYILIGCFGISFYMSSSIVYLNIGMMVLYLAVAPYFTRFKIQIDPGFFKLKITFLGFNSCNISVPLRSVIVQDQEFNYKEINPAAHVEYSKSRETFLQVFYDNGFDGPIDFVSFEYKGKEVVLSASDRVFEAALWQKLLWAFRGVYKDTALKLPVVELPGNII